MKFWELKRKAFDPKLPNFVITEKQNYPMGSFSKWIVHPQTQIDSLKPINVEIGQSEYQDPLYGDFVTLYSVLFVVHNSIIPILSPLIGDQVEFLPLDFSLRKISIMHVTNVVKCLDDERSEFAYFDERKTGVKHYVFMADCLEHQHIFVLSEDRYLPVYVSDDFKSLVEENSLEGLRFVDAQFEII